MEDTLWMGMKLSSRHKLEYRNTPPMESVLHGPEQQYHHTINLQGKVTKFYSHEGFAIFTTYF